MFLWYYIQCLFTIVDPENQRKLQGPKEDIIFQLAYWDTNKYLSSY